MQIPVLGAEKHRPSLSSTMTTCNQASRRKPKTKRRREKVQERDGNRKRKKDKEEECAHNEFVRSCKWGGTGGAGAGASGGSGSGSGSGGGGGGGRRMEGDRGSIVAFRVPPYPSPLFSRFLPPVQPSFLVHSSYPSTF
ncbi:hypothetical protein M0804_002860 [Polistes exclamans]|nr:hypothetical protein M0804_002860 [Polistes exclamans]